MPEISLKQLQEWASNVRLHIWEQGHAWCDWDCPVCDAYAIGKDKYPLEHEPDCLITVVEQLEAAMAMEKGEAS